MRSVTFDKLDSLKAEMQKSAVASVLERIYQSLQSSVMKQISNQMASAQNMSSSESDLDEMGFVKDNFVERLFLANSKDLIRLLVTYNLVHCYPQLQGDEYVKILKQR